MIIHFICRGNAFRSIIAEAYLNSLKIKDLSVLSSGTAAIVHKARNLANHRMTLDLLEEHGIREFAKSGYGDQLTQSRLDKADITVCMNQRVYDECLECVTFPASPRVWSVADIGEPGRISDIELERQLYRAEAYQEIVRNVEPLVSDVLDGQTRLTLVAYETRVLTSAPIRAIGVKRACGSGPVTTSCRPGWADCSSGSFLAAAPGLAARGQGQAGAPAAAPRRGRTSLMPASGGR